MNCKYYLENNFNDNCKAIGVDEFSIIQLNVRSIPKNLQHFELFISNLNIHFTVVCITESWLKESNVNAYALTGYKHEHVCRKHKAGGGVSLFILGPLLFLLYVNDIVEVSSVLLPILYADDTSLFLIGKNINVLIHNMNDELAKVLQWLNCNKLSYCIY